MRATVTQRQLSTIPAEQFALDRTLKHLRKLRWIGREHEAEEILQVLSGAKRQPPRLAAKRFPRTSSNTKDA